MKKKIIKLLFGLNAVLIAFSGCGSTGEETAGDVVAAVERVSIRAIFYRDYNKWCR